MESPRRDDVLLRALHEQEIYIDALDDIAPPDVAPALWQIDPALLDSNEVFTAMTTYGETLYVADEANEALAQFVTSYLRRSAKLHEDYDKYAGMDDPHAHGFQTAQYVETLAKLVRWLKSGRLTRFGGTVATFVAEGYLTEEELSGGFIIARLRLVLRWLNAMAAVEVSTHEDFRKLIVGAIGARWALLQVVQVSEGYNRLMADRSERSNRSERRRAPVPLEMLLNTPANRHRELVAMNALRGGPPGFLGRGGRHRGSRAGPPPAFLRDLMEDVEDEHALTLAASRADGGVRGAGRSLAALALQSNMRAARRGIEWLLDDMGPSAGVGMSLSAVRRAERRRRNAMGGTADESTWF